MLRVLRGTATWAAEQLQEEVHAGAWIPVATDAQSLGLVGHEATVGHETSGHHSNAHHNEASAYHSNAKHTTDSSAHHKETSTHSTDSSAHHATNPSADHTDSHVYLGEGAVGDHSQGTTKGCAPLETHLETQGMHQGCTWASLLHGLGGTYAAMPRITPRMLEELGGIDVRVHVPLERK